MKNSQSYPDKFKAESVLDYQDDPPVFHVGQGYDEKPASLLRCKKCGGDRFQVGQGDHFTAVRCVTCEYEVCIHEG